MVPGVILGHVNSRGEAVVPLPVHGPAGRQLQAQFVIDSGFNGQLSMPFRMVRDLGLTWFEEDTGTLADGSRATFDVYLATVLWLGQHRRVTVNAMESPPTIGTELLMGHAISAQWVPGGSVRIEPLRPVT